MKLIKLITIILIVFSILTPLNINSSAYEISIPARTTPAPVPAPEIPKLITPTKPAIVTQNTNSSSASNPIIQATSSETRNTNVIIVGGNSSPELIQKTSETINPETFINTIEADGFNPGNVISNEELYRLPKDFDSADKIKSYLKSNGSFLADYKVQISFEDDDDLWTAPGIKENIGQYAGKEIDFSEFIWRMTRTNFSNSCSLRNKKICINQKQNPINPAVILALIQRESGLIKGSNAKSDPSSPETKFLLERSVGYLCLEDDDKTKSCFDQNPDWKYFKGMFRQVYYGMRLMLINAQRCEAGDFGNTLKVGGVGNFDGEYVKLENGLSCAIYVYTPHILAQRNIYKVYKEMIS